MTVLMNTAVKILMNFQIIVYIEQDEILWLLNLGALLLNTGKYHNNNHDSKLKHDPIPRILQAVFDCGQCHFIIFYHYSALDVWISFPPCRYMFLKCHHFCKLALKYNSDFTKIVIRNLYGPYQSTLKGFTRKMGPKKRKVRER